MTAPIILITGATSGIGFETARALATTGAHLVLACRNRSKAEAVRQQLAAPSPSQQIDLIELDLASLAAIDRATAEISQRYPRIDVLINNAGVMPKRLEYSADGYELNFAVNYLAPFRFTLQLLPLLQASGAARVVNVSSMMHRFGRPDFDSWPNPAKYRQVRAYGSSKLGLLFFTYEFARRYHSAGITANAIHPGAVDTAITDYPAWMRLFLRSPSKGAASSVYLATSPQAATVTGGYFVDCKQKRSTAVSCQNDLAAELWQRSEAWVAHQDTTAEKGVIQHRDDH